MDEENEIDAAGMSSEDLLRQARNDLASGGLASTEPPPAASPRQAAPPHTPPPPQAFAPPPPNPAPSAAMNTPAPPADLGFTTPAPRTPMAPPPKPKRNLPIRQILIGVGVVGFLLVGWVGSRGKTSSDDLSIGDCFEIPSGETFTNVSDQPCTGPHEAQIYGRVVTPIFDNAEELCIEELLPFLESYELPLDASLATIEADSASTWFCAVTSPSGQLQGAVLGFGN